MKQIPTATIGNPTSIKAATKAAAERTEAAPKATIGMAQPPAAAAAAAKAVAGHLGNAEICVIFCGEDRGIDRSLLLCLKPHDLDGCLHVPHIHQPDMQLLFLLLLFLLLLLLLLLFLLLLLHKVIERSW